MWCWFAHRTHRRSDRRLHRSSICCSPSSAPSSKSRSDGGTCAYLSPFLHVEDNRKLIYLQAAFRDVQRFYRGCLGRERWTSIHRAVAGQLLTNTYANFPSLIPPSRQERNHSLSSCFPRLFFATSGGSHQDPKVHSFERASKSFYEVGGVGCTELKGLGSEAS